MDTKTSTMTAGPRGPILLQDVQFLDEMSHFDRERIPERVVHAKGGGAFGYFEVTHDVTKYCKAKIFDKIGKKTPCLVRFSTVGKWIYQTRDEKHKLILVSHLGTLVTTTQKRRLLKVQQTTMV